MVNEQEQLQFNKNAVLILTSDGVHREPLSKVLTVEGFQVHFVSTISDVVRALNDLKCGILLHDWDRLERSQGTALQQRFAKMDQFASIIRFVFAQEVTPQLLALAVDCGVRRVISYSTSVLNLVNEVRMSTKASEAMDSVQAELHRVSTSPGKYSQEKIDELAELAYKKFPHDPVVGIEYGNLCFRREEWEKSEKLARELLRKNPNNVRAMNLLSRVLMKHGKMTEAIDMLQQANTLSPKNADRLIMLGDAFFKTGDTKKAGGYFSEAMSADQGNTEAAKGLATVKISDGDANAALDLIKGSLSEEEAAGFFNNAAVLSATGGKVDEGLRLYETALKALKSEKLKPQIHYNIALAYKRQGNPEEALKSVKRALKLEPKFEKALRLRDEVERLVMGTMERDKKAS